MDELVAGNPDITWTTVPKDELSKIHESVNGKLRTIQIPEIKKDVFEWRMARGLQDKASSKCHGITKRFAAAYPMQLKQKKEQRSLPKQVLAPVRMMSESETPAQGCTGAGTVVRLPIH